MPETIKQLTKQWSITVPIGVILALVLMWMVWVTNSINAHEATDSGQDATLDTIREDVRLIKEYLIGSP